MGSLPPSLPFWGPPFLGLVWLGPSHPPWFGWGRFGAQLKRGREDGVYFRGAPPSAGDTSDLQVFKPLLNFSNLAFPV